jgi:hypothetical protein
MDRCSLGFPADRNVEGGHGLDPIPGCAKKSAVVRQHEADIVAFFPQYPGEGTYDVAGSPGRGIGLGFNRNHQDPFHEVFPATDGIVIKNRWTILSVLRAWPGPGDSALSTIAS